MNLKKILEDDLYLALDGQVERKDITINSPKEREMGDYAVPCFNLSKILRKNPNIIAEQIKGKLNNEWYQNIEVINGYLNIFINKIRFTKYIMEKVLKEKEAYGNCDIGKGKIIVIDYSSPNIAKPFGVGHLRSTVIGNALKNICEKNGYKVVGINYLGDFGTQFGKLIYAYKTWGNEEAVRKNPIAELKKLYVQFHEEAALDEKLNDQGRLYFKKLEDGDEECVKLWKWFKEASLLEFQKTYDLLGIKSFDSYDGESFYNDKMGEVLDKLEAKNLLELSEGAYIVRLEDETPALIKRSDGATLYITRDLAAALYRKKHYHFDEALYVVGNEQTLHFNQLKAVLEKMGYDWYEDIHHISFGLILQNGKKMSTRHGKSVELQDLLNEAITLASDYIENRDMTREEKRQASREIGVGAVIFNDLKNYRTNDIEFNLEDILKFEGETGPYIQYTYARINSLLKKQKNMKIDYNSLAINQYLWNIVFRIYNFDEIIIKSKMTYDPSLIAKYLIDLCQDFNRYYANERFITDDEIATGGRLLIAQTVSLVLKEGMRLLGITMPNKM
ncbi:MAG: arginine--tRNA ligase [Bacilli bacterium]|nr:arginine--tRNA ligase [Bacilli bacterium]